MPYTIHKQYKHDSGDVTSTRGPIDGTTPGKRWQRPVIVELNGNIYHYNNFRYIK